MSQNSLQPYRSDNLKTGTDNICFPVLSLESAPTLLPFQVSSKTLLAYDYMGHT
jgi:hypothetical protein